MATAGAAGDKVRLPLTPTQPGLQQQQQQQARQKQQQVQQEQQEQEQQEKEGGNIPAAAPAAAAPNNGPVKSNLVSGIRSFVAGLTREAAPPPAAGQHKAKVRSAGHTTQAG